MSDRFDTLNTELIDNASITIAIHDKNYNIKWANRNFLKSVGLTLEEVKCKKCYTLWGFKEPCPDCHVANAIKRKELVEGNVTYRTSSDEIRQWNVKTSPIKDTDDFVDCAIVAYNDITPQFNQQIKQKKTMEALLRLFEYANSHTEQELLQKFLDEAEALTGSQIGFYHFADDENTLSLQMWSTKTMKVCSAPGAGTHYPIKKAGMWVDCVRTGAPVVHNDYMKMPNKGTLPEGHVPLSRELVVPVKRGGKVVAILGVGNKRTHYDEYDVEVVGQLAEMAWETVVRKRSESAYKELQEQYAHAQKMESIGRLAGGIAHDFNNMLGVIIGHVDLALLDIEPKDPLHENLDEINNAAKRSAGLTNQLLAFARQQTIEPKQLSLNMVIEGMFKMLRRLIGENIDLQWIPGDDLGLVTIDPGQIEQILANLCVNAHDAIDGVGQVIIETKNSIIDEAYAEGNPGFVPGAYILLEVSDNGCGMEPDIRKKVFEPFFTTKKTGEGTGLGLATVYGIVKQNKGFVNIYSEAGKGTTFKIYFRRDEFDNDEMEKHESIVEFKGGSEVVLLVEDEEMILNVGKLMLQSLGYHVLAASTPGGAIKLAKKHSDDIDLVLTDVVMPEMNGRELVTELEIIIPDIKTLFMSGYTSNIILNHGVLQDGVKFLQKPFLKRELAIKVRESLK